MRTPHYLTPLKTTKIPRRHIVFDCETRSSRKGGKMAHRWVCGSAAAIGKWNDGEYRPLEQRTTLDPKKLWRAIAASHGDEGEMACWAHNLGFDLRVSEALRWLPMLGYQLEAIVLENTAAWASFSSQTGKLTICDLHSWLPVTLDRIAADMGYGRSNFDYEGGTDAELLARCAYDVKVTSEAVCAVLNFLEGEDAGPFRPTGSGQSHAMWRRRFLKPKTILIHDDEHALERERTAMWAGRAEAWSYGLVKGPLYEYDMNLAYCRIAAEHMVPVKLTGKTGARQLAAITNLPPEQAVLADVTVRTEIPLVPMGDDGRVFWPVGTFNTTLWTPELDLLARNNVNVIVHRTWRYRCEPVLSPMATWLIEQLEDDVNRYGVVVKRLLKHWARTLVGRCALRYRQWDDYGTIPVMGLSLSTATATSTETAKELLQVGERIFELSAMAEADSSIPQITGWVMSRARTNLWEVIQHAGESNVLYLDTDSVLVRTDGHKALQRQDVFGDGVLLVHKATYGKARIYGPRNIVLEDERRISGVPRKAKEKTPLHFTGEVWTGLRTSLESRQASVVGVQARDFAVDDVDPRRERTPNGRTTPYRMEQ